MMRDCLADRTIRIPCESCGGEGRIYKSRRGGNDPDVWDAGPCPECDGTAYVTVETHPVKLEDIEPFPKPRWNPGGAPCGECHLKPREVCDICGAEPPGTDQGKDA